MWMRTNARNTQRYRLFSDNVITCTVLWQQSTLNMNQHSFSSRHTGRFPVEHARNGFFFWHALTPFRSDCMFRSMNFGFSHSRGNVAYVSITLSLQKAWIDKWKCSLINSYGYFKTAIDRLIRLWINQRIYYLKHENWKMLSVKEAML